MSGLVSLRLIRSDDAPRIQSLLRNYNVSKTTLSISYPYPENGATEWIDSSLLEIARGESLVYAIVLQETKEVVGVISVLDINNNVGEIGYWLGEKYWNKGFGKEAAMLCLKLIQEKTTIAKLLGHCLKTNSASSKVLLSLNMKAKEETLSNAARFSQQVIQKFELTIERG